MPMPVNKRTCPHGISYDWSSDKTAACPKCFKEQEEREKKYAQQAAVKSVGVPGALGRSQFSNPTLTDVTMLLVEMQSWRIEYENDGHNGVGFSREIVRRLTGKQVRCGLTVIHFDEGGGHAVVAFDTDAGLVFIEPQTCEQEDVIKGAQYSGWSHGLPVEPIVDDYDISWNNR